MEEIINRVAKSPLITLDLEDYYSKHERVLYDLKDNLFMGLILKEKDFREKVAALETEDYKDAYVYIFCSADAIIPLWAYFLITSKISGSAKKVVYGSKKDLETLLMHEAIAHYDFETMKDKVFTEGNDGRRFVEGQKTTLFSSLFSRKSLFELE